MSTRHVSAENQYPFISSETLPEGAQGIVDLWFVVHGAPLPDPGYVGSSSTVTATHPIRTELVSAEAGVSTTVYTFFIYHYGGFWMTQFTAPHTGTGITKIKGLYCLHRHWPP